jgi:hypothetical protein
MTNSRIKRTWAGVQFHINKTVTNISKDNNQIDWTKEELLINRLEQKLGKPKEEVTKMVSQNLLTLLSMVPFSTENK